MKGLYAWTLEITKFIDKWGFNLHEIMRMDDDEYITVTLNLKCFDRKYRQITTFVGKISKKMLEVG